jgi:hypothetical protein
MIRWLDNCSKVIGERDPCLIIGADLAGVIGAGENRCDLSAAERFLARALLNAVAIGDASYVAQLLADGTVSRS